MPLHSSGPFAHYASILLMTYHRTVDTLFIRLRSKGCSADTSASCVGRVKKFSILFSILGPMVYGVSYCPIKMEEDLKKLECADSKTLTEKKREEIFETLKKANDFIGWMVEVISPNVICNRMLQRCV